jgi:type IV pilus assembly protein PilV
MVLPLLIKRILSLFMINNLKNKKSLSSIELLSTRQSKRKPQRKSQAGSGLIEVMVSLLILGVGLLGMLSLQANGLNGNQRASFVTEAQLIAQDMADRIIATTSVASSAVANADIRTGSYGDIDVEKADALNAAACNPAGAGGCNPAGAKAYNQNEWLRIIRDSSLPSGRGLVLWTAAAGGAPPFYRVQVMWDQDRVIEDATDATCTLNNCFQMEVRLP